MRPDGDPVAAVRDLATRAEALEVGRARDAQDRDAFVESLGQGVLTVDEGSRIVGANAAAHTLLDQPPGALLGRTLIEAFLDTQVEAVAHAALEAGSATGEVAVAGADGPKLVLRARRAPSGGAVDRAGGRLGAAPAPADPGRVHRQPVARAADAADDRQPARRDADPRGRGRRRRHPGPDARPDRQDRGRDRATSSRWSTSCSTCRGSRAAARSASLDLLDLGQVATESVERLRLFADRQGVTLTVDVPAPVPAVQGDEQRTRAGPRQPPPQRGEVQPRRRRGAGHGPCGRPGGRRRHRGPRRRHPAGGPGADLRAVLQGRPGAGPRRGRRNGPRAGDRAPHHRAARRPDLGRVGRGVREHVLVLAAGRRLDRRSSA